MCEGGTINWIHLAILLKPFEPKARPTLFGKHKHGSQQRAQKGVHGVTAVMLKASQSKACLPMLNKAGSCTAAPRQERAEPTK